MTYNNEPLRNVLVAVDVQNDFIDGSLAIDEGDQVVAPINEVASAVRMAGGDVVFTRDWHPAKTPHFADYGGQWPVHCVAGTEGASYHPQLDVREGDTIIDKGTGQTDGYSGIEGASKNGETLETIVAPRAAQETVRAFIGGLATDYCVKATALDLAERFDNERVRLYLLRDAVRAVGLAPNDEAYALEAMRQAKIEAISSQEARELIERGLS